MTYNPFTGSDEPDAVPARGERPVRAGTKRQIYGRVYELFTDRPDLDGEHPYVGKTTQTIHQRVFGSSSSAHTSAQSIAIDPWKARIRKGRAGYRQLEVVYATGDQAADERELRRAEAFWIDRLRPAYNDVRPVRPPVHEGPQPGWPASARTVIGRAPSKRDLAAARTRARARRRTAGFLTLFVVATVLAAWFTLSMDLPWPAAPWVASPVAGLFAAIPTFQYLDSKIRRITGRRR